MDAELRFYSPRIVRVLKTPRGGQVPTASLAVTKQPQAPTFSLTKTDSTVTLTDPGLRVVLHLKNGQVALGQAEGDLVYWVLFFQKPLN